MPSDVPPFGPPPDAFYDLPPTITFDEIRSSLDYDGEPQPGGRRVPRNNPNWWSAILPDGLRWHIAPRAGRRTSVQFYSETVFGEESFVRLFPILMSWLEENNLRAYVRSDTEVASRGALPYCFFIAEEEEETTERPVTQDFLSEVLCGACGTTHMEAYHSACPGGLYTYPCCNTCTWVSRALMVFLGGPGGPVYCTACLGTCIADGCEDHALAPFEYCSGHAMLQTRCAQQACQRAIEFRLRTDFDGVIVHGVYYCVSCAPHRCRQCGYVFAEDALMESDTGHTYCAECFSQSGTETNDSQDQIRTDHLRIREIPGREQIRMCGIEIEGGNGDSSGEELAQRFYAAGVSTADVVAGYHHGRGLGFAHVENDSSVDWEAVIGPVNMADREQVRQLNLTVRTIRSMVHADELRLDMRCGLHIHVGAERVSLDGAFNLNTLFAYIEDPLYRLAAARWPMHRALVNSHYTQPVMKTAKTKVEFGNLISRAERYHSLSFTNYINSMMNNCECGAVRYDSWDQCTCPSLGKCTFEFRLFNSTANPTKLHAYLALTQALVAKALSMDPADRSKFESMEFIKRRFKDMDNQQQERVIPMWEERLEWMFTELPLTDGEKNSLLYVAKNSELLSLGESRLAEFAAPTDYQTTIEEVPA